MQTLEKQTSITLKNILFATDFSTAADNALSYAAGLAQRFGAKLHVVHAAEPANYALPPQSWRTIDEARNLEVKKVQQTLEAEFPRLETEVQVWEGAVERVLPASIARVNADLVILGTHGRTGFGKVLLGSAAEDVLRLAPCPVLTIGPHAKMHEFWSPKEILYATDFSPASIAGAQYAVAMAHEYKAKLTLLHVIEERKVDELVHPSELKDSSLRLLSNLVPSDAGLWVAPQCEVRRGEPAETILEVAKQTGAELIVLGARKPSGVPGAATHLPIATVHKVVTHATCPVLTVRHTK